MYMCYIIKLIRLTPYDLGHIKRIAAKEGIPYQTSISSILHKYVWIFKERGEPTE